MVFNYLLKFLVSFFDVLVSYITPHISKSKFKKFLISFFTITFFIVFFNALLLF